HRLLGEKLRKRRDRIVPQRPREQRRPPARQLQPIMRIQPRPCRPPPPHQPQPMLRLPRIVQWPPLVVHLPIHLIPIPPPPPPPPPPEPTRQHQLDRLIRVQPQPPLPRARLERHLLGLHIPQPRRPDHPRPRRLQKPDRPIRRPRIDRDNLR